MHATEYYETILKNESDLYYTIPIKNQAAKNIYNVFPFITQIYVLHLAEKIFGYIFYI